MPDSFFASQNSRKRKRPEPAQNGRRAVKPRAAKSNSKSVKQKTVDEELSDQNSDGGGIDDLDLKADRHEDAGSSGGEDDTETPAEKRLRLAKLYLESVKSDLAEGEYDAAEIDKELVNGRLKQDMLEHSGKLHLFIADSYDFSLATQPTLRRRGHRLSVTAAIASESCEYLFTAGKEGSIIRWSLRSGKRLDTFYKRGSPGSPKQGEGKETSTNKVKGHTDEVLALAVSSDGRYLVSGGKDRQLCVWDAENAYWIRGFRGPLCHRDTISALAFRKGTHQLYTGSFDRTLKVFDLSPNVMGYVETLYGHQDRILSIDALRAETCVSVGAQDKTTRFWKIVDETHLVFRGGGRSRVREVLEGGLRADEEDKNETSREMKSDADQKQLSKKFAEGSLECIAMIDEHTFVTGGDSGSLCLWTMQKKRPIFTHPLAHGRDEVHSLTAGLIQKPRWITSVACLRYSDLFASGSWDGSVRLWKVEANLKYFSPIGTIPASGVVNSLQLLATPKEFLTQMQWSSVVDNDFKKSDIKGTSVLLVIGLGQEHRLGRWIKIGKEKKGMNGAIVALLLPSA